MTERCSRVEPFENQFCLSQPSVSGATVRHRPLKTRLAWGWKNSSKSTDRWRRVLAARRTRKKRAVSRRVCLEVNPRTGPQRPRPAADKGAQPSETLGPVTSKKPRTQPYRRPSCRRVLESPAVRTPFTRPERACLWQAVGRSVVAGPGVRQAELACPSSGTEQRGAHRRKLKWLPPVATSLCRRCDQDDPPSFANFPGFARHTAQRESPPLPRNSSLGTRIQNARCGRQIIPPCGLVVRRAVP